MFSKVVVRKDVIVALLLSVFLVAGCGSAAGKEVKLTADDSGRQIALEEDQTLVISLVSNPTTGYSWGVVESEGSILRQMGEAEFHPQSDLVGASGVETIRLEATRTGQVSLQLDYRRPWETGVDPLDTFTVQVVVR